MSSEPTYYLYKMTVDDGGAPCVQGGALSLAICKPMIRRAAKLGDLILGFAANRLQPEYPDNSLIYIARITRVEEGKVYFSSGGYGPRRDSIYRWREGRFAWKEGSRFHRESDLPHDLGRHPVYEKARVILSVGPASFRYFGNSNPITYKSTFRILRKTIETLGQGHRRVQTAEFRSEIEDLAKEAWDHKSVRQKVRSGQHGSCGGCDHGSCEC